MVASYTSFVELSSLNVKIENLEDELHDEKENHRGALTKCQELEEQLQRYIKNQILLLSLFFTTESLNTLLTKLQKQPKLSDAFSN